MVIVHKISSFFLLAELQPHSGLGRLVVEVSRSHTTRHTHTHARTCTHKHTHTRKDSSEQAISTSQEAATYTAHK